MSGQLFPLSFESWHQNFEIVFFQLLIENSIDLKNLLKVSDVFILDRGFRDEQNKLEENNFKVLMPVDNELIPKIGCYFRIASFLNNTFGKRPESDNCQEDILQRMHGTKKYTIL